ncbi:hypothetical protein pdam_00018373 [Pocillopora damicornis]|uniref:Uncharacterized protein n=1 Tax=Pocillopora damicornis TaxID=46731 RepID=A0A3M6V0L6_POCDA|nr:hypothetical protein pdam_00018373 [Pocillopora damicornis]
MQLPEIVHEDIQTAPKMEDQQHDFTVPYVMTRFLTSTVVRVMGYIAYVLFFIWQVIGLILYTIRAFEVSLNSKRASFQLADITSFNRSEELELAWVMSQICNCALVLLAVSRVPSFLGWSFIPRLLVQLPAFWSLLALFLMTVVGYGMILVHKNDEMMEICLILALTMDNCVQLTPDCNSSLWHREE